MALELRLSPLEYPCGGLDPEEVAALGLLEIRAGDRLLTAGTDVSGDTPVYRPGPYVSGYHLAEWLVWNWWRLRWEPPITWQNGWFGTGGGYAGNPGRRDDIMEIAPGILPTAWLPPDMGMCGPISRFPLMDFGPHWNVSVPTNQIRPFSDTGNRAPLPCWRLTWNRRLTNLCLS